MSMAEGKPRVNLDQLEAAVAEHPGSARAYARLGSALLSVGLLSKGEAALDRAVELDPGLGEAWVNLGGVRLARWDFRGCVEANERALECNPQLLGAHFNLGLSWLYLAQPEQMIACFEKVLEMDPDHAGALYHLAIGFRALGDTVKARDFLAKAEALGYSPDPALVKALEKAVVTECPTGDETVRVFELGSESDQGSGPEREKKRRTNHA